jgi:hypothetical protein
MHGMGLCTDQPNCRREKESVIKANLEATIWDKPYFKIKTHMRLA